MVPALALCAALALSAPAAAPEVPEVVRAALQRALALPGARLEVSGFAAALPARCGPPRAEALQPLAASGRAPLRLLAAGAGCEAYGFAQVRVFAPGLAASRTLEEGEPLAGAVAQVETEVRPGHPVLGALPAGALAGRAIAAGAAIEPGALRTGPRPGDPVTVELKVGDVTVRQVGRALPCARGRACALLPGGRRVEGRLEGDRIAVEAP